jgi:hypothetical protein
MRQTFLDLIPHLRTNLSGAAPGALELTREDRGVSYLSQYRARAACSLRRGIGLGAKVRELVATFCGYSLP